MRLLTLQESQFRSANAARQAPRSGWRRVGGFVAGAVMWAVVLQGSLSLADVRSSWSGALCGPWGCTAPLEAVVSCHLSWLVVMAAALWFANRFHLITSHRWKWIIRALVICGISGVTALALREVSASDWQLNEPHLWHRIGLRVVGFIDFPVLPSLAAGIVSLVYSRWRACHLKTSAPETVVFSTGGTT